MCSSDLFTLDALGEQGGGEDAIVVEGGIYHYNILFLTWIPKHGEDDIFASHGLYDGSMGRKKNVLFLCLFLGEKEHIFSHTLHDVVGGGDDIISLALDDQEVMPSLKGLIMCINIIGDLFDKEHVKEWRYELTRAYLQEPTALSLESLGSLM